MPKGQKGRYKMRWLCVSGIRCLSLGIIYCSIFAFPKLLLGGAPENSDNNQDSAEVLIAIAGKDHRYKPRPDLGYVVKTQDNGQGIASAYEGISSSSNMQIKSVAGRDRRGLWIVESRQLVAQNEAAIKTLSVQKQFQYAAPLFSCNGSKITVIPEIVVRVKSDIHVDRLQLLCRKVGCTIIHPMEFTTQEYLLGVQGPNAEAVFTAVNELNKIPWIEWAAPNVAFSPKLCGQVIPNDEYFPLQWHLHNTGQIIGTPTMDINAPEAWEITTGDPNIVVAVLDTGVDTSHPDLVNNLVPGYDFYSNDDLPDPVGGGGLASHGTICSGLIAAEGNNFIGVTGVTWKCKIMPIRTNIWDSWYVAPESEIATAIRWAAVHGADILSNSWGYLVPLPIIHSAFVDVTKSGGIGRDGKGCIVFGASGNDNDSLQWPERYSEVISVGATDDNDLRRHYSNYGPDLDIVAPSGGDNFNADTAKEWIWSTDISGSRGYNMAPFDPSELDYAAEGGTSCACPIVAGVAALMLSIEPELTNDEVRHFLERSAKDLGNPGRDDYYGWGRVDARAALDMVLAKRCDLNNDWKVGLEDLLVLIEFWGTNESSADIAPATKRDGIMDEQDLELLMRYWQAEIPELGLIAHWKLDETEGMVVADSAGDNNGYALGDPVWQPDGGQVDGALQLDGVDDYVITGPIPNLEDGPFSVIAWIKGGAPGQAILSQMGAVNWLCTDPSEGHLMTELAGPGRNSGPLWSQTGITDGEWHRIGFVWDGSHRTLYVDSIVVAEDTQPGLQSSSNGLYIGTGKAMAPTTYWSGLIDDIRIYIYNRAVSP